jgi:hypothetical protein
MVHELFRPMTLPELIQDMKLRIEWKYMPQDIESKEWKEWKKWNHVRWMVKLYRKNRFIIESEFKSGIACLHLEVLKCRNNCIFYVDKLKECVRSGRDARGNKLKPSIDSFVHCLIMDAEVLDYRSFEAWANEFGYSSDSIKAKAIYDDCLKQALILRNAFSDADLKKLQDAAREF